MGTTAQTAQLIRQELHKQYPATKFKVISNRTGSSCISINYTDNILENDLHNLLAKYKYINKSNSIPQVQYIFITNRLRFSSNNFTQIKQIPIEA